MVDSVGNNESEFYEFVTNELAELQHPYNSAKDSYLLNDATATARLFIAVLRYQVPGRKPWEFYEGFLKAFHDFRSDVASQANALKPLGTACEAFIEMTAQILNRHNDSVGAWTLTGPDYLDVIHDRTLFGKRGSLTRDERGEEEKVAFWIDRSTGEALIYRARRTRNGGNHGFEKMNERERVRRFYDLIGACLYITDRKSAELDAVIYADEKSKEARAVKNLYSQAVDVWKRSRTTASKEVLQKFREHRNELNIDADGLQFLLESEYSENSNGIVDYVIRLHAPTAWGNMYLRWIDSVNSDICNQTLHNILNSFSAGNLDERLASQLVAALCKASNVEFQREVMRNFVSSAQQPAQSFFESVYRISDIPTESEDVLPYLQSLILSNQPVEIKNPVANRLLVHYHRIFPRTSFKWIHTEGNSLSIQNWVDCFPRPMLNDEIFRNLAFKYLELLSESSNDRERRVIFQVEMLKLLHDYDPNQTVATLHRVVEIPDKLSWELLRTYDPQTAIQRLASELSRPSRLHDKSKVALIEMMKSPETDALLLEDLEKYIQEFKGGSNRKMNSSSWCNDIRSVIAVIGRRRVVSALTSLTAIATRDEPEYIKLSCLAAIAKIGREESLRQDLNFDKAIEDLESMSQKDRSDKVRKSAVHAVKVLKKAAQTA